MPLKSRKNLIPGGTSAGYLEQGDYPHAAAWFLADVGLTLSVVGTLGQVTAKAGSVVKSGSAIRLGKALHNAAKIGQYRHVALGGTIATGILGAESGVGAVSDVLNGRYTDATIKGIDAVFAALGVASSGTLYREVLTDAAKANKKLAEKVDVQKITSKTDHDALAKPLGYTRMQEYIQKLGDPSLPATTRLTPQEVYALYDNLQGVINTTIPAIRTNIANGKLRADAIKGLQLQMNQLRWRFIDQMPGGRDAIQRILQEFPEITFPY